MGGSSSSTNYDYDAALFTDQKAQSVYVGEETKGETRPRRSAAHPEIVKFPFQDEKDEKSGVKSVWDAFQRGVSKAPKGNCYGTRVYELADEKAADAKEGEAKTEGKGDGKPASKYKLNSDGTIKRGKYVWETYEQIDAKVRAFGSGLVELGCKSGDNVGIWAINRVEWMIASLALYSQNMRTVALYATLGAEAVDYIMNHAETRVVVIEKESVKKLIKSLPKLEHVRVIIQIDASEPYKNVADTVDEADIKAAAEHKVQLLGFNEVIKMGEAKSHFPVPPSEEDLCFIMYTSGTTGMPKGALLRHGNIMATVACVPYLVRLSEQDLHVSYLPLAHIFETVIQVAFLVHGAQIGFFQGNVKKLTNDFIDLQPTLLCGVPRVFSKIYQKVFSGVAEKSCTVKWYFNKAYTGQCDNLRAGKPRDATWDSKVFVPLRQKIGMGRTRTIISGAAPLPAYLHEFLRVATGAAVLQGYGLTETAAATSVMLPSDRFLGHTGPPLMCNEVKLVDVPEMGYLSTDAMPRGEILVRGPNVFAGYYKNEKATGEALTKDGWLQTGDIGRFNPNGTLSIIDRKKNIFKLSQGEYIAAEKIENLYAKSSVVGQIWVYGNSFKSTVMAVVVPAADVLAAYCLEKGWWPTSKENTQPGTEAFAADFGKVFAGEHAAELKQHILTTMREVEKDLKPFERVQDIIIESRIDSMMAGFTEANECLTPTFKLRRQFLLQRYIKELQALYTKHGEPDKEGEKWTAS